MQQMEHSLRGEGSELEASSECACLERAQDLVDEELDVVVREALRLHDRVHVRAHQRRHQVAARRGTCVPNYSCIL